MGQILSKIPDVRVPFLDQNLAPVPSVKEPGINNNNNFTNLLKKAFQLNLQCQYLELSFPKIPFKKCCFIFTLNTSKLVIN